MNSAPTIALRFRSTAPLPHVERTLLLPATCEAATADPRAHCEIPYHVTIRYAPAAPPAIPTVRIACTGRPHRHRWGHGRLQFP